MALENAQLGILMTLDDQATPKLRQTASVLEENRMAMSHLAMGVGFLGMQFAMMGVILKQSESQLGKNVGTTFMMVGAVMTAISTTVQFVKAIGDIVKALRAMAVWQTITKALSGPAGWATLAIGAGVAAGSIAGINAMAKSEAKATNVTINNQGSVVSQKQLVEDVRKGIIQGQQRNNTSGIR